MHTDYTIVNRGDLQSLSHAVYDALAQGWQCLGGPFSYMEPLRGQWFAQAMVLPPKKED